MLYDKNFMDKAANLLEFYCPFMCGYNNFKLTYERPTNYVLNGGKENNYVA